MLSAIAAAVLASVPFTSNYTPGLYPGFSGGALRIDGWEPAEDGSFPVVLFFGPTGFSPDRNLAVVKGLSVFPVFEGGLTEHLPDCGFIVAAVEYPSYSEYIATCDYLIEKAESLFTEPGNPFEQICSRPKADCSQGVGLVGVSQGAHFASLAATLPGLAYEVTAALSVAGGTKFTAPPLEDGPEYECLSNETLSAHLPSTKRRSIVSGSDAVFGTTVDEVLRQQKELTGYDCGTELNCIQEDGSGYIVIDPALNVGHGNTALFAAAGDEPWSLAPAVEWLMTAAYKPAADSAPMLPRQCRPGVLSLRQMIFFTVFGPVLEPLLRLRSELIASYWPAITSFLRALL